MKVVYYPQHKSVELKAKARPCFPPLQLQEKHEGVKLQWIVPPDGNVFHKEKKKEVLDRACEDLN